jgi:hypothetical protein
MLLIHRTAFQRSNPRQNSDIRDQFFDSIAIFAKYEKSLKVNGNPPSSQEAQLSFLLNQFQAIDIKIAFANAIGKVGSEAQTIFYPLPLC